jgi:hypothetical protein
MTDPYATIFVQLFNKRFPPGARIRYRFGAETVTIDPKEGYPWRIVTTAEGPNYLITQVEQPATVDASGIGRVKLCSVVDPVSIATIEADANRRFAGALVGTDEPLLRIGRRPAIGIFLAGILAAGILAAAAAGFGILVALARGIK